MEEHRPETVGGPRLSRRADLTVRWLAVVLTLAGAVMLFSGFAAAAVALPLVAVGASLVAIEQTDRRRGGRR